ADGLELPLRLAGLWQQLVPAPLRRTQTGDFFKRDLDRLRSDPLLNAPPAQNLADLPDAGLLTVALARAENILEGDETELRAGSLLGLAFSLRLLQAARDAQGAWLVRLSPLGRWILGFGEAPPVTPPYPQTLLVQPNLEIIVYRQGLTPALISRLSRFALWK